MVLAFSSISLMSLSSEIILPAFMLMVPLSALAVL
jgi:hypothetical protein